MTRPLIGITMGDPAGIGPEIVRKALNNPFIYEICRPVITGDARALNAAASIAAGNLTLNIIEEPHKGIYSHGTIDLICESELAQEDLSAGNPCINSSKAMISYITKAADLALEGRTGAIVTAPINKMAMKMAGSAFHGHTELIAARAKSHEYAMMMTGNRLSVVLVTIHIPFKEITEALSTESIYKTIMLTGNSLKERFGIERPRIAVAGLNPHGGEEGLFGSEEEEIILPAVKQARESGFDVFGPLPPDTVFYQAASGEYDAVICMYHDQGLIPFKMIHFADGVNTTLGLPIIRTSVDHGTAYDIAGRGIADEGSLIEAIKLAARQAANLFKQE